MSSKQPRAARKRVVVKVYPKGSKQTIQGYGDTPSHNKRQKKSIEDDLICPITLELPYDPVFAEDGRVYERSAIEEHINNNKGPGLKSPFKMVKMGERLFPALQHKNIIETSIENGAITGDLARTWKEKAKEEKRKKALLKKAKSGDGVAMGRVGACYNLGRYGFEKNYKLAYTWYQRAHEAGNKHGTAMVGKLLIVGEGVLTDQKKGMVYLGMAEGRGALFASFVLGLYLADGLHGIPVDKKEARRLLSKALSSDQKDVDMSDSYRDTARKKLDEILQEL